jgi:hypothetical protein
MSTTRKLLAATTAAAVLSLGAAGTAFAQGDDGKVQDPPAAKEHRRVRRGAIRTALEAAAGAIGVTRAELKAALDGGSTIADLAESKGVEVQTVVDAIVDALNAKVDELLAGGEIDEAQAARAKERIPGFADKVVHHEPKRTADSASS